MPVHPAIWLRRIAFVLAAGLASAVSAQSGEKPFSAQQIDQLTAQIALYPDPLLSQVLMASTYPADVAEAAKWSRAHSEAKGDEAVKQVENQPWDPAVQSLVSFPQVIITMGENPKWVQDLGDAFLAQPEDVMDSVQRLRAQAQKAGNLRSTEQTKVSVETAPAPASGAAAPAQQQIIVIQPAQPQTVFVPTYNPATVYGPWPYAAYPPIYVPPPPGFWFSTVVTTGIAWGIGIGITNALWGGCSWGWGRGSVNVNVNRYNNINVNRRLDVNNTSVNWNHNVQNRRNVAYRGGDAQRDKLDRKYQSDNREQYRGRDDSRERAAQAMQNRGMDVDKAALGNRAGSADRGAVTQKAQSADRGAVQTRAQEVDRDAARARAQHADHGQMQARAQNMNRDNALRGAGDHNARQQIDRGAASQQAMQQRPQVHQAAARSGGGGAQIQRPAGAGAHGGGRAGKR